MRNQNPQNKIQIFSAWSKKHRIKSSSLVFAAILAVGGGWLGVNAAINGFKPKAAKVESEFKYENQIPGWWFSENFGASVCEAEQCSNDADPDSDKLSNYQEFYFSSNPNKSDTNDNGLTDGEDVSFGYAPNKPGKVTFEQALSDDNIVSESLLFNEEVKQVVTEMSDLSSIKLPEVNDLELQVVTAGGLESFTTYMTSTQELVLKYFPEGSTAGISDAVRMQDMNEIEKIKINSATIAAEMRKIPVSTEAVQLHKYQIAIWEIIPTIVQMPAVSGIGAETLFSEEVNKWYDSTQALIALSQKVQIELFTLRKHYESQIK